MRITIKNLLITCTLLLPLAVFSQASLSGRVQSSYGDRPIATVQLAGTPYGAISGENGSFMIKAIPEGEYAVTISSLGYRTITDSIHVIGQRQYSRDYVLVQSSIEIAGITITEKSKTTEIDEQPYAVDAINITRLHNSAAALPQVLNRTAGVRIREEGGLGSNFNFSLNGFSGNQVRFFLDGIPMDNFGSSLALNNLPVNMIERVEVYKGVVPVWLGTDALGGAVNIVTNQSANFLDASYSFGSFNTHRASINAAYTNKQNGFTVRTNIFTNYADNDYDVFVPIVDLETRRKRAEQWTPRFHDRYQSAGFKVETGLLNKKFADLLLIGVLASANEKQIQNGVTMEQVFGQRTSNSRSLIPTLRYRKADLFVKNLDFSYYAAYNQSENQFIDTSDVRYNWLGESVRDGLNGAEASRTRNTNTDGEFLSTANLAYSLSPKYSFVLNHLFTGFNRTSFDPENPNAIANNMNQYLEKQTLGLAFNWTPTSRLTATIFAKNYWLYSETFREVDFATENQRYETFTSKKANTGYGLAAAYEISQSLKFRTSFEHAYRLPEGNEMFGDGLFVISNPDLQPEESDNVNFGLIYDKHFSAHSLHIEANMLWRRGENFIRPFLANQHTEYINVGKISNTGFEFQLNYKWKDVFMAGINATYQNLRDKTETVHIESFVGPAIIENITYNDRIPNMPYLYGNLSLGLNLPSILLAESRWSLHYYLGYVHEYFLVSPSLGSSNKAVIPTQISHGAELLFSTKDGKYNLGLEATNFTDNLLYDNFRLQRPGRAFSIKFRYAIRKS